MVFFFLLFDHRKMIHILGILGKSRARNKEERETENYIDNDRRIINRDKKIEET